MPLQCLHNPNLLINILNPKYHTYELEQTAKNISLLRSLYHRSVTSIFRMKYIYIYILIFDDHV